MSLEINNSYQTVSLSVANDPDALKLSGGTMTGPIYFDGTSGQFISKGLFDTSRGGNYGISLVCSIGYEFNWQAGWLTTTNQGSSAPRPLYLDSLQGTTLRSWNSNTNTGTEVSHVGITFPDNTTLTSGAVNIGASNNTQLATSIVDGASSFALQAIHANTIVKFTEGPVTVYLTEEDSLFPIGAQVVFINMTEDVVSFTGDTGAVTIYSADNLTTITKNYGIAVAIKIDVNTYVLSGNLA